MPTSNKKVAVITGAARGIGLAVARRFLGEGYRVALLDIDQPVLEQAASDLGKTDTLLALACDVAFPDQVQAAVDETVAQFGRILRRLQLRWLAARRRRRLLSARRRPPPRFAVDAFTLPPVRAPEPG